VAGLMVGHTPEFLGKKIERPEIILVSLALLIHPLVILAPSSWSMIAPYGVSSLNNAAMHGYSEVLYTFASAAANNGSAFAGLNADTPWYNLALGFVILLGRYPPIIFMMAVAGSVAAKPTLAQTIGTLRNVHGRLAGTCGLERDGTSDTAQCSAVGVDFQCCDYPVADSSSTARGAFHPDQRRSNVLSQFDGLWCRRADRSHLSASN
jgi:hypothetical protein